MPITYETLDERFLIFAKRSEHAPPHVHKHFEFILVTEGTLELGIGTEFFHMEKGDFAVVFPGLVHHYQVFEKGRRRSIYLLVDPAFIGTVQELAAQQCPADPVIKAKDQHPDIAYAMKELLREKDGTGLDDARRILTQLLLARARPHYRMIGKSDVGGVDLVYQVVAYMAAHYNEDLSLPQVAHELGVNQFAVSRVFSHTFHSNFNRYLNKLRLDRASELLLYTDHSITDICYYCGFESQRTFNRAFKERFRESPREFRRRRPPLDGAEEPPEVVDQPQ